MRAFRVVSVLTPQEFNLCFSVYGGLKRSHKGHLFRSLREAGEAAEHASRYGWYSYIIRRLPEGGWQCIESVAPEFLAD